MDFLKDFLPIIISVIALAVSIYFSYQTTLKKKAKISYFESWDVHLPSIVTNSNLIKNLVSFAPFLSVMYLVYSVELENIGDKATVPLEIILRNVDDLKVVSKRPGNLARRQNQYWLRWEPLTFKKPEFKDGKVVIGNIPPYYRLRLFIELHLFTNQSAITEKDIPYIGNIRCRNIPVTRMNEPFEEGSLQKLEEKLHNQFMIQKDTLKTNSV